MMLNRVLLLLAFSVVAAFNSGCDSRFEIANVGVDSTQDQAGTQASADAAKEQDSAKEAPAKPLPLGIVKEKPAKGPYVKTELGYMVAYKQAIPGTNQVIEMIPIPGGKFMMGSPESQEDKYEDETPQIEVRVPPMWMAKTEITWGQFNAYTDLHDTFKEFQSAGIRKLEKNNQADAVTVASSLYDASFTYEAGDDVNSPAATMTQFTARQYTKWLSLLTGNFYRLPYEAEWEYACRGGTQNVYHFGDDAEDLEEYGWFEDNSDDERQVVAQKKPNDYGLYDMHGNVAEWVLDQYDENWYEKLKGRKNLTAEQTYNKPTKLYPRVIRGGSWELDADSARCAFRMKSDDEEWKDEDPNFPASPWWYTTEPSTGVGFRLMRPLVEPKTREKKNEFWESGINETGELATTRIKLEGRGALGLVDPKLPKAIEDWKIEKKKRKDK